MDGAYDVRGIEITAAAFDLARHNGAVTIENPQTGQHRSFRITTVIEGDLAGRRLVQLLTGPDNETGGDWKAFGFVEGGRVRVWQRCRDGMFERYARMLERPAHYEAKGLRYFIGARCRICNRPLTHPESLTLGVGPVCAKGLVEEGRG